MQQSLLFNLLVFSAAAVPGYILACLFMDRIGHRQLQLIGFPAMGAMFLMIALIPGVTSATVPFLLLFGGSYFFAEFGPNTTTFVMAAECYPTSVRTTGHGLSAGIAKLGAFLVGVYLFPQISHAFGLAGALKFAGGMALVGTLLTLVLPEPSRRSLEDISRPGTQPRRASAPRARRGSGRGGLERHRSTRFATHVAVVPARPDIATGRTTGASCSRCPI